MAPHRLEEGTDLNLIPSYQALSDQPGASLPSGESKCCPTSSALARLSLPASTSSEEGLRSLKLGDAPGGSGAKPTVDRYRFPLRRLGVPPGGPRLSI